ncbi:hypothetical protein KMI_10g16290 [Encephalitozoon hellem]|nr:hypothetical protein KMI_10g16290 [Encephalitozoon hellem]
MDFGNLKSIRRETIYLIVGDDIIHFDKEDIHRERVHLVDYFKVGKSCVIRGKAKYLCSCGYEICWHIMKVIDSIEQQKNNEKY